MGLETLGGGGFDYVQSSTPTGAKSGESWLDESETPPAPKIFADVGGGGSWVRNEVAQTILDIDFQSRQAFDEILFNQGMNDLNFSDGFYDNFNNLDKSDSYESVSHTGNSLKLSLEKTGEVNAERSYSDADVVQSASGNPAIQLGPDFIEHNKSGEIIGSLLTSGISGSKNALRFDVNGKAVTRDSVGNIIVAGNYVVKYDSNLNFQWEREFAPNKEVPPKSVLTDSNDNIYVSHEGGNIECFNPSDGSTKWDYFTTDSHNQISLMESAGLVGVACSGKVKTVSMSDGTDVNSYTPNDTSTKHTITSYTDSSDSTDYWMVGSQNGNLTKLNSDFSNNDLNVTAKTGIDNIRDLEYSGSSKIYVNDNDGVAEFDISSSTYGWINNDAQSYESIHYDQNTDSLYQTSEQAFSKIDVNSGYILWSKSNWPHPTEDYPNQALDADFSVNGEVVFVGGGYLSVADVVTGYTDLEYDSTNEVYYAISSAGDIDELDLSLSKTGNSWSIANDISFAENIGLGNNGHWYVSTSSNVVKEFDETFTFVSEVWSYDSMDNIYDSGSRSNVDDIVTNSDGSLIYTYEGGYFVKYDSSDGSQISSDYWRDDSESGVSKRVAINSNDIVISVDGSTIKAVDSNGAIQWTKESLAGDQVSVIVCENDELIIAGEDGTLAKRDSTNGEIIWNSYPLKSRPEDMDIDADGNILIVGYIDFNESELLKFDSSGNEINSRSFSVELNGVATGNYVDEIYTSVGDYTGLHKYDENLKQVWTESTSNKGRCVDVDSQNYVIVGTSDGFIESYKPDGGDVDSTDTNESYVPTVHSHKNEYIVTGMGSKIEKYKPTGLELTELFSYSTGNIGAVDSSNSVLEMNEEFSISRTATSPYFDGVYQGLGGNGNEFLVLDDTPKFYYYSSDSINGTVTKSVSLSFVPNRVVIADEVSLTNGSISYSLSDGDGNTETINRGSVDTEVDISHFTNSQITVEVNLSRIDSSSNAEIESFGVYFD